MIKSFQFFLVTALGGFASVTAANFLPLDRTADLSGDSNPDLVLFDSSRALWRAYNLDGERVVQDAAFGSPGMLPITGRFLETAEKDLLSLYDPVEGAWKILTSEPDEEELEVLTIEVERHGIPVVGDFLDLGVPQLALFNRAERSWTFWTPEGRKENLLESWGYEGFHFLSGDTTGDGVDELIAYDTEHGVWHLASPNGAFSPRTVEGAAELASPIVRDFNGDGRADLGTWSHEGDLRVLDAADGEPVAVGASFGDHYSLPVHADYEGKGKANLSYFSPLNGVWHLRLHDGTVLSPNFPDTYSNQHQLQED